MLLLIKLNLFYKNKLFLINHANPLLAKFGRQKARFLGMRAPEKLGKQDQGESKGPHRYVESHVLTGLPHT